MMFYIREATEDDVQGWATVQVRSWQSAYRNIMPDDFLSSLSVEKNAEGFLKAFETYKGASFYFVAIKDEQIIGNLVLSKCRDEDKPSAGEIIAIYLLEEYWDMGYGRLMLEHSINTLKQKGFKEILIWVLEENHRARTFYEKFGFVLDGSTKEVEIGKRLVEVRYSLNV